MVSVLEPDIKHNAPPECEVRATLRLVPRQQASGLSVPVITADDDAMSAAFKYAKAGWRVVPLRQDPASKHPGSVLGDGWQYQSSCDPAVIASWYAGTNYGVGLHAGASGAVIFDIDKPELLPEVLLRAQEEYAPQFQSTRPGQPRRGHMIFALRPGQVFGNSRGKLYDAGTETTTKSHAWGEVRGTSGFIVAEPSAHTDPDGAYGWQVTGSVPYLPHYVSELLPLGQDRDAPATDAAVEAFLAEHSGGTHAHLMARPLDRFEHDVASGGSRHESLVAVACWIARDARAGLYDASTGFSTIESLFLAAMAAKPTPGRHPANEFAGVLAWAVAQVTAPGEPTPAEHREAVLTRLYGPAPEPPADPEPPPPREEREPVPNTLAPTTAADPELNPEQERDVVKTAQQDQDWLDAVVGVEQGEARPPRKHLRERVLTIVGLRALRPVEPLIDGLLARDTVAQIIGAPGEYKTFLTLGMALCVATGESFEGHRVRAPGPVVYVAAEGSSGLAARALAWCHLGGINPDSLDGRFYVLPEPLQLGDALDVTEAAEFANEIGAALLVLDTRARCTVGLEENSNTEQGQAYDATDRIRRASGCTVLVVHHSGRQGDHARGGNVWDGNVWSELRVSGSELRATIKCEKHKEWEDGCKHAFRMAPVVVPTALMPGADEQQRSTLVAVSAGLETAVPLDTKSERIVAEIVETIAGVDGLTKVEVRNFAEERDVSRAGAYRAINALVTAGLIRNVGTDRTPRYVSTGRGAMALATSP